MSVKTNKTNILRYGLLFPIVLIFFSIKNEVFIVGRFLSLLVFEIIPGGLITQPTSKLSTALSLFDAQKSPSITLDNTLAGLFREHGVSDSIVLDIYNGYTHVDIHPQILRETVYIQDEDVGFSSNHTDEGLERFRTLVLAYKTVKFLLGIGPIDVYLYRPANLPANIDRLLSPLPANQRPQIHYIDLNKHNVQDELRRVTRGKKLWYYRPKSYMLEYDTLVHPDFAYEINDKRFLLHPTIPTPDLQMAPLQGEDLSASVLSTRPLPFVVKLRRCSGSRGTWIVTREDQRQEMLTAMAEYQDRGVPDVQISEFIHSTRPHYSVNFFVGAAGPSNASSTVTFLGATEQLFTQSGRWAGAVIDYRSQKQIQEQLMDTINAVARTLIGSYVGWAGIDVIIDAHSNRTVVVDLNARLTGGFVVCLLSNHFMKERGLPLAQAQSFHYEGKSPDVYTLLAPFISKGQVIVAAATESLPNNSTAQLIFGGRTREELFSIKAAIQERLSRCLDRHGMIDYSIGRPSMSI
ncbi:TPA_exp: Uncharacterized protein A8136_0039 [Trichophyton benhamiae CBS 112371]|uniref:ATP-grasp domain-containing protein n=1 Tax=Arthroderma benhamiae (strain ATCC MYA-4681 / CBS 112371) TaxID=663331 RepID=D4AKB7_ARTBC|nr:uncharacterized protein ARB_03998 [Trichophyton benhamiae CBS 112371]EFE36477.1 hypothetical protein ARB_03998 [Trichophyton benhamiae CBS 112371]DAA79266.1 TPA_exp: Uncharacterized protein A8136_0039 [Trichophyton benhamiae CBS 112371]